MRSVIYSQGFQEMPSRLRGPRADELAEPRPDTNFKGAAFTMSEKSINTLLENYGSSGEFAHMRRLNRATTVVRDITLINDKAGRVE